MSAEPPTPAPSQEALRPSPPSATPRPPPPSPSHPPPVRPSPAPKAAPVLELERRPAPPPVEEPATTSAEPLVKPPAAEPLVEQPVPEQLPPPVTRQLSSSRVPSSRIGRLFHYGGRYMHSLSSIERALSHPYFQVSPRLWAMAPPPR